MSLVATIPYVYEKLGVFIIANTRISALLATFVLFRKDLVNTRIIVSLSSILSFYVIVLFPDEHLTADLFSIQMMGVLFFQFLIGFIAGLILNLVFEVFSAFGQIVSMQIGLSMASLIDPRLGNITSLTRFYTFSMMLVFLFLNGHLFAIKTVIDSFTMLPMNHPFIPTTLMSDVLSYSGVMFSGSILLSITVIVAVMITNFAFAVISKFAPQFNLFSIGVNLSLVVGLICVFITFNLFIEKGVDFFKECMGILQHLFMKAT